MANYYYFVSSLPMLMPYCEPYTDSATFAESCEQWLSDADLKVITTISLNPVADAELPVDSVAAKWFSWEINLRNRIAKLRANKQGREVSGMLLEEKDSFGEVDRIAQDIASTKDPLEAEKLLDDLRWSKLDDLEACHPFDLDKLCVYKLKLELCEKWLGREEEKGRDAFNKVIDAVYA